MAIPYGKIEPVVPNSKDKNLNFAFSIAQARILPPEGMDARRYYLLRAEDDLLKLALHQVHRRHCDSTHKFPCRLSKIERQGIEIYGNYWWEKLKLCERLHSYESFGKFYINAAQWFMLIILDHRQLKAKGSSNEGKKSLAELISQNLKSLRNDENPYDSDSQPHLARLMDAAISLGQGCNQFRRYNWNPFLRAYAAWRNDLRQNTSWYAVVEDDEGKHYNQGVGRQKTPTFRT
jgi:hypothetical protein